ncbi:hypothetical protein QFC19_007723 [Naganishia cerealis]|uniref:Uncharacterized protein n=1 Tax=Naganishia cerealis TaxID=610337 RepID=A0ACC2V7K3_9TREE|nr:hypothetical protein QFC19_007723 [Naganishia cerealis]
MSNAVEKWKLKVRRRVGCHSTSGIEKLRGLIKYSAGPGNRSKYAQPLNTPELLNLTPSNVYIQQDAGYKMLEKVVNAKIDAMLGGTLHLPSKESKSLAVYEEETEILDIPQIVIQFHRSLGLLNHLDDATRLDDLRQLQQKEGRSLVLSASGEVRVAIEEATIPALGMPMLGDHVTRCLEPGLLDIYDFQRNLPANTMKTTAAIRSLRVVWDSVSENTRGSTLTQLVISDALRMKPLPPAVTQDDEADLETYQDWLRRVENPDNPFSQKVYSTPSVGDYLVFVFSNFQYQLLEAIPRKVRRSQKAPEQEGQPYIKAATEQELTVPQNIMRESYVGLPGRLTGFVATQYSATRWAKFTDSFFPSSQEACDAHPGWLEPQATYLDLWRRLLERAESPLVAKEMVSMSRLFVGSFKLLPDHIGGGYEDPQLKVRGAKAMSLWDDTAFEKKPAISTTLRLVGLQSTKAGGFPVE